jgi:hypothetical protein
MGAEAMTHARTARRALLPLVLSILAAIGSGAQARDLKPYRAEDFEKVIIPSNQGDYLGRTILLTADQSGMAYLNLGYRFVATNQTRIVATVGGIPYSIPAGSLFTRRKVKGGHIAELPADAVILCGMAYQQNLGKSLASAVTLGLTQAATRYMEKLQLCGVDADRDGAMEKLFLVGAKQQQDLAFTSILPVPYQHRQNHQVEGYHLVIYLEKYILSSPSLVVGLQSGGKPAPLAGLWLERADGKMRYNKTNLNLKTSKLPQEIRIGPAVLIVKRYDDAAGTADVEFVKFFENQKVEWSFPQQTITIYMPR